MSLHTWCLPGLDVAINLGMASITYTVAAKAIATGTTIGAAGRNTRRAVAAPFRFSIQPMNPIAPKSEKVVRKFPVQPTLQFRIRGTR